MEGPHLDLLPQAGVTIGGIEMEEEVTETLIEEEIYGKGEIHGAMAVLVEVGATVTIGLVVPTVTEVEVVEGEATTATDNGKARIGAVTKAVVLDGVGDHQVMDLVQVAILGVVIMITAMEGI